MVGWPQAEDRGDNDNVVWPLAGDRGDSEKVVGGHWQETEETVKKWWGGHWQKTEETMTMVGWSLAEDRGDNDIGGVATGRRQRRQ